MLRSILITIVVVTVASTATADPIEGAQRIMRCAPHGEDMASTLESIEVFRVHQSDAGLLVMTYLGGSRTWVYARVATHGQYLQAFQTVGTTETRVSLSLVARTGRDQDAVLHRALARGELSLVCDSEPLRL